MGTVYHEHREISIKLSLNFTGKGTIPASARPSSDLPGSLRPSAGGAGRSSDLRHQTPWAGYSSGIRRCPFPVGQDKVAAAGVGIAADTLVPGAGEQEPDGSCPAYAGGCRNRHSVAHSGYTSHHLPISMDRPPCPKNPEAIRAILAARMAFSSFSTFRPLK